MVTSTPDDGPGAARSPAAEAADRLRDICHGFPEVTERLSHGSITFFIRDKRVLCYLSDDHHGDGRLAVIYPAPDGVQAELIAAEPERFFRPPYVGHRGWVGLRIDIDPDFDEVSGMLHEAYRQVAPKALIQQLEGTRPTDGRNR
jgi:hypothetical protein